MRVERTYLNAPAFFSSSRKSCSTASPLEIFCDKRVFQPGPPRIRSSEATVLGSPIEEARFEGRYVKIVGRLMIWSDGSLKFLEGLRVFFDKKTLRYF